MVSSMDTAIMGSNSMDKPLALFWQLLHFFQAQVSGVTPGTSYSVTVNAVASSGFSSPVSRILITTNESLPAAPSKPEGERVGSTRILLSWRMPMHLDSTIHSFAIRYKEMCPYPDPTFNEVIKSLDIPETQLNTLSPGATYNIKVCLIAGLDKDSSYKVCVAASTAVGESPLTNEDYIFVMTLEDEPDSPPRDLAVVKTTSSTATLTWSPPEKPNGIIRLYEVSYTNGTYSNTVNSTLPSATLHYMKPYTHYNVTVRAFRLHGDGNQISYRPTLQMLLGEDVPGSPPYDLTYENIGSSYTASACRLPHRTISQSNLGVLYSVMDKFNLLTKFFLSSSGDRTLFLCVWLTVPGSEHWWVLSDLRAGQEYSVWMSSSTSVGDRGVFTPRLNFTMLEDEPKDPPKNVTLTVIPEEVTCVYVTFFPPDEPNGNISAYHVSIYRNGQLDFYINSLPIAAANGAVLGPSSEVQVTTGVKGLFRAPLTVEEAGAALNNTGVIISTSMTITIEMPECFYTDDHGPIQKVQVIVFEPAVMEYGDLSNWKSVFLYPTAPYLTDEGFLNPKCLGKVERMSTNTKTYVIEEDESCLSEDANTLCNRLLKPKTYYMFKFRATNIRGQYTYSESSDRVRTAGTV
ncbi:hypothetical protein cypCar_00011128 [Cyprinus carpio]|nr:hypothetical protein cypCar_00011128 [Cyprinus carpio]